MLRSITCLLAGGAALASALAAGQPSRTLQDAAPAPAKREAAVPASKPSFSSQELYEIHKTFLDTFISPANAKEAKKINSTLLSEDVQGKIDVTRTFNGRELNTEYLFGLFANLASNPSAISLLGVPTSYEILNFVGSGNVASSQVRYDLPFPPSTSRYILLLCLTINLLTYNPSVMFNFASLHQIVPVELGLWNTYNSNKQITAYSATFKYWQWAVDTLIGSVQKLLGVDTPEQAIAFLTGAIADGICSTHDDSCSGTNLQYSSKKECMTFLTKTIRFGKAYEMGRNTLLCRSVHQNMVAFRPDAHCSHIGPSGGGMCSDDKTYNQTVMDDYFRQTQFVMPGLGSATAKGVGA